MDARPKPVFPHWVGHFNVVTALLMGPGAFAIVHKSGPLAWNGWLSLWVRMATFAVYVAVMFLVARSAIKEQTVEESFSVPPGVVA
jgi:hypothetical protein